MCRQFAIMKVKHHFFFSQIILALWLVPTYDLLKDRRIDDIINILVRFLYHFKQVDSMLLCISSVIIRSQKRPSKCGKNISDPQLLPCVPLFCPYHILTSSVIYYWTDTGQPGIYLLILQLYACWLISMLISGQIHEFVIFMHFIVKNKLKSAFHLCPIIDH